MTGGKIRGGPDGTGPPLHAIVLLGV